MLKITQGQVINVQAYKHDGRLYRQWNGAKVIEVSSEHAVLFMYKTKVLEENGQKWVVREPMLWFFEWEGFYNTTALLRPSGTHFYTNLASPAVYEEGTIKYIDYDLDIKAYPAQKMRVVDKKEWSDHIIEYGYSDELVERIEETTEYVKGLIKNNEGYFDDEVIQTYIADLIEGQQLSSKWKTKK